MSRGNQTNSTKIFSKLKDDFDEFYTTCCNCNKMMPLSAVNQHSLSCVKSPEISTDPLDSKNALLTKLHEVFSSRYRKEGDIIWAQLEDLSKKAISLLQPSELKPLMAHIVVLISTGNKQQYQNQKLYIPFSL